MAGHKKRNGGCGCGGICGNPHCGPKRKNGTKVAADQHQFARWRDQAKSMTDAELLYSIKDARKAAEAMRTHDPVAEGWYEDEAFTYADELRHRRERAAGKRRNPKGVKMYHTVVIPPVAFDELGTRWHARTKVTRGTFDTKAQAEEWARSNLRGYPYSIMRKSTGKRRNPSSSVHTSSEDYRLGLFQGAMEKGKLPPPHDTSADFKRGYADGAKVAAARPTTVAESLGVYKATGSQQQAGAVLYDAVKGEAVATLRNPSLNVRNPTSSEHSSRGKSRIKLLESQLTHAKGLTGADRKRGVAQAMLIAGMAESDLWDGVPEKDHAYVERLDSMVSGINRDLSRNPSLNVRNPRKATTPKSEGSVQKFTNAYGETGWLVYDRHGHRVGFYATKPLALEMLAFANSKRHSTSSVVSGPTRNPSLNVRNPMSAAARKHLAHEKGEEKAFASMMAALAEGVTVKVGAHRVRKLSKGYVVIDGERLTTTQAAAKLHRGK